MFDVGIFNGRIVEEDRTYQGNIYIKNGKIAAITMPGEIYEAEKCVEAKEMLVFPGAVDAHMHIGEYKADFEDMETSTKAALAGGVTTCIDMPLNLYSPSVLDGTELDKKDALLARESYVDYQMWGALVPQNMDKLLELHQHGAASFKCFLSGGGNDFYAPDLGQVREAMKIIRSFDGLAGFHCEDFGMIQRGKEEMVEKKLNSRQAFLNSRPLSAELIATKNIITLAKETGCKVHICHVSHPKVAELIREAKGDGVDITAETCAHYLTFTEKDYIEKGCLFGCAPPLRDESAREGLWEMVRKGVIDCISSDHSPGMPENRDDTMQPVYESGYGISGVQTMFQVVFHEGRKRNIPYSVLAKALSSNAAKRWGIYGKKGAVKVGFDADLVLVKPEQRWKIQEKDLYYKQKISAFCGLEGNGKIVRVYLRGKLEVEDGLLLEEKGIGKRIR